MILNYMSIKSCINEWYENSNKGLIVHATGSGKTISAIFAIKSLVEKVKLFDCGAFKISSNQWYEELRIHSNGKDSSSRQGPQLGKIIYRVLLL